MVKAFILVLLLIPSVVIASSVPQDLCQSWRPAKKTEFTSSVDFEDAVMIVEPIDKTTIPGLVEFEKCLLTYVRLSIQAKQYQVMQSLQEKLNNYDTFALADASQYQRQARFSTIANTVLPSRETTLFGYLRRTVAYFYPSIDMYQAIQVVRGVSANAAIYLDYLFKVHDGSGLLDSIQANIRKARTEIPPVIELYTIFAMHAFGHLTNQDLDLSQKAADSLERSYGLNSAQLIFDIMNYHVSAKPETPRLTLVTSSEFLLSDGEALPVEFDTDIED